MPIINENPHEYDVTLFWAYEEEFDYSISHVTYETHEEYRTVDKMYDLAQKMSIREENKVTSEREDKLYENEKRTYYEMKRAEFVSSMRFSSEKWRFNRCLFFIYFPKEVMYNFGFKYEEDYVFSFDNSKEDYKLLFIFKLRHLTPTKIIEFLSYQYAQQDFSVYPKGYADYLRTLLIEYDYMLSEKSIKSVKTYLDYSYEDEKQKYERQSSKINAEEEKKAEKVTSKVNTEEVINEEKQSTDSSSSSSKIEISIPKVNRISGDEYTILTLQQTKLLIYYLREAKLILGSNDKILSNIMAAQAFKVLTGYSAETLRRGLTNPKLEKSDLIPLRRAIEKIFNLIIKELEKD